ncbi:MAG: helicase-related protein, partial [Holosporales bacterium]
NAKDNSDQVIQALKKQKIQTLVLDEAHHLRNEWWKALTKLKEALGKPTIVSLTATPPYDVEYAEWQRYQELCGAIDAEISVPELVLQGDLCPHQDYVYFTLPHSIEAQKLDQFHNEIQQFVQSLLKWEEFKAALLQHPYIINPNDCVEKILDDPSFFSSILIFLHEVGIKVPSKSMNILGVSHDEIPDLSNQWLETLLNGVLFIHRDEFASLEKPLDDMQRQLKRIGALELRKVSISNPKAIQKLLAASTSKLDAIIDITRLESEKMNDALRMVILSDYIRKSEIPNNPSDLRPIDKMGVIPIFESIRRANIPHIKLGVLTGGLIFIPATAKLVLTNIAEQMQIDLKHIRYSKAEFDERFLWVEVLGEQKQNIVHLITELFNQGAITVLVGTQALLGEGWDAPSVNTLILASTVGSYMLSNQMRGRALRIDPAVSNSKCNTP